MFLYKNDIPDKKDYPYRIPRAKTARTTKSNNIKDPK